MNGHVRIDFVDKTGKLLCFTITPMIPMIGSRISLNDHGVYLGEGTIQSMKWVCQADHALLAQMEVKLS